MNVIYKITNMINGKIYIGQTTNFDKRIRNYKYPSNVKSRHMPIMQAIRKYGWDNFKIEIIDKATSIQDLNQKEKYWISENNSTNRIIGYNVRAGGENSTFSIQSRYKMSVAKIGKFDGINNPMHGKNHTTETKIKISEKAKHRNIGGDRNPFFAKHHSDSSKIKMGAAVLDYSGIQNPNAKLNKYIADQIREDYKVTKSSRCLAKKYNVSKATILDIINGKRWI